MPNEQKQLIEEIVKSEQLIEQLRQIVFEELEKQKIENNDIDTASVTVEAVREIIREEFPALLARSVTTIEGELNLLDSRNIIVGSTTGSKIATSGGASGQKIGFFGSTPVVQQPALTAQKTTITHTAPGTEDFAIQNLTQTTPFGFVSQDEGNTALTVIANLQTRMAEIESRLETLGLIISN